MKKSEADYIFLGDTDHMKSAISRPLADPAVLKGIAEMGIADICIELPRIFQKKIDEFQKGAITRDEFIDHFKKTMVFNFTDEKTGISDASTHTADTRLNILADLVERSAKFGITVHAVDNNQAPVLTDNEAKIVAQIRKIPDIIGMDIARENGWNNLSSEEIVEKLENYLNDNREKIEEKHDALADSILKENPELAPALTKILKDRLNLDSEIGKHIIDVTGGRRAVIFYGYMHENNPNGIDEALGDNVLKIRMVDMMIDQILPSLKKRILQNPDSPAAFYNVRTGNIIPGLDRDLDARPDPPDTSAITPASTPETTSSFPEILITHPPAMPPVPGRKP